MSSCHPDETSDTSCIPKHVLTSKPQFDCIAPKSQGAIPSLPYNKHQVITWDHNAVHNLIGEWSSDNDEAESAITHTNGRSTQQGLGFSFGV
eukprot:CAMPEP_0198704032 /NCGR_PEP_ID=MMETSP1468-20131203/389686_1 /TAXON_ID=1461545 /ORGANISM="Mantoniella sp, Strain CCMP1436" /LENGTH=91 /DNA_ID=CAMNT_0044462817 /DNA_START=1199 /DNA_END=1474 /DNA_ORIENTATION=+